MGGSSSTVSVKGLPYRFCRCAWISQIDDTSSSERRSEHLRLGQPGGDIRRHLPPVLEGLFLGRSWLLTKASMAHEASCSQTLRIHTDTSGPASINMMARVASSSASVRTLSSSRSLIRSFRSLSETFLPSKARSFPSRSSLSCWRTTIWPVGQSCRSWVSSLTLSSSSASVFSSFPFDIIHVARSGDRGAPPPDGPKCLPATWGSSVARRTILPQPSSTTSKSFFF